MADRHAQRNNTSEASDGRGGNSTAAAALPTSLVSWFLPSEAPLQGFREDPLQKTFIPASFTIDISSSLTQGVSALWSFSVKARLLAFLLVFLLLGSYDQWIRLQDRWWSTSNYPLVAPLHLAVAAPLGPVTPVAASVAAFEPGMDSGGPVFPDPTSAFDMASISQAEKKSVVDEGLKVIFTRESSLWYVAGNCIFTALLWVFLTPFVAVLFQVASVPAAFAPGFATEAAAAADVDAEDPDAAASATKAVDSSGFFMEDPYVRSYFSALKLLWVRALVAGAVAAVPVAVLDLFFVLWAALVGLHNATLLSIALIILFCMRLTVMYVFTRLTVILAIEFIHIAHRFFFFSYNLTWALPYFVDHPSHGAAAVVISFSLSQRAGNKLGQAAFGLVILLVLMAGRLLGALGIPFAISFVIVLSTVFAAYCDIMPDSKSASLSTWGQAASLGWLPSVAAAAAAASAAGKSGAVDRVHGENVRAHGCDAPSAFDSSASPSLSSSTGPSAPQHRVSVVDPDTEETGPSFDSLRNFDF